MTKSTKSQQRRASRPPLQTSAHLRECAAGSMRAGKVLLPAIKQPRRTKKRAFSDIEIRIYNADDSIYLRDFFIACLGEISASSLPRCFSFTARANTAARKNRADSRKWVARMGSEGERRGAARIFIQATPPSRYACHLPFCKQKGRLKIEWLSPHRACEHGFTRGASRFAQVVVRVGSEG